MKLTIAPSILSADFGNISEEIALVSEAGASWIHLDVMDGVFVPNITFGPAALKCFKKPEGTIFDAHLMIVSPEKYIEAFVEAGADIISVHAETTDHLHRLLQQIKDCGVKASVALNPATPLEVLEYVYDDLDMVVLMSVNPGWGGQKFIPAIYRKIAMLKKHLQERQLEIPIQVDGGVNLATIQKIAAAGATNLVAGNAVFEKASTVDEYRDNLAALLREGRRGITANRVA